METKVYSKEKTEIYLSDLSKELSKSEASDPIQGLVDILLSSPESGSDSLSIDERNELEILRVKYENLRSESNKINSCVKSSMIILNSFSSVSSNSNNSSMKIDPNIYL
mmetsp:Transcript_20608/g.22968  ORF Transcript_20608/g.22968 Transcript_20608/m.22968 type:complete len:109 (-) Transcript_20608:23-349(-)